MVMCSNSMYIERFHLVWNTFLVLIVKKNYGRFESIEVYIIYILSAMNALMCDKIFHIITPWTFIGLM
jgi:hypothetical protein